MEILHRLGLKAICLILGGIAGIAVAFFLGFAPVIGVISFIIGCNALFGVLYLIVANEISFNRTSIISYVILIGFTITLMFTLLLHVQDSLLVGILFFGVMVSSPLHFLICARVTSLPTPGERATIKDYIVFTISSIPPILFVIWVAILVTFVSNSNIYSSVLDFYLAVLFGMFIFSPRKISTW